MRKPLFTMELSKNVKLFHTFVIPEWGLSAKWASGSLSLIHSDSVDGGEKETLQANQETSAWRLTGLNLVLRVCRVILLIIPVCPPARFLICRIPALASNIEWVVNCRSGLGWETWEYFWTEILIHNPNPLFSSQVSMEFFFFFLMLNNNKTDRNSTLPSELGPSWQRGGKKSNVQQNNDFISKKKKVWTDC